MHYREADKKYFEIVQRELRNLFLSTNSTVFPETCRAFMGFCAKTNSLKSGLFDAVESDNPYVFNALFRCLCEHYLKFLYIWVRFASEKTDEVALDYFSCCGAVEARDYLGSIQLAEKLLGNEVSGNVYQAIAKLYPRAASLSNRELEAASGQFKYRAILRYLHKAVPEMIASQRPFLAHIVPAYALLSSFVHGGPYSDMELYSYADPKVIAECEERAGVAFMMAASVFMMSAAAISREFPQNIAIAGRVQEVLDEFTGKSGGT